MIYWDIVIWREKLFRFFQHLSFLLSRKFVSLFKRLFNVETNPRVKVYQVTHSEFYFNFMKFLTVETPKNPVRRVWRIFFGGKMCKSQYFEENVWIRHIWTKPFWRLPKQSRILKKFYFPVWPLVKFGPFLSWVVVTHKIVF